MIVGNESIVNIDGGTFIRLACFGQLKSIAEEKGMTQEALEILDDAIDELHIRLDTRLREELKKAWLT